MKMSDSAGSRPSPSSGQNTPRASPLSRDKFRPEEDGSDSPRSTNPYGQTSVVSRTISSLSASVSNPYAGRSLPSTDVVAKGELWSPESGTFPAQKLWEEKGVVIMLIRRPGCVLCRYQARELWLELKNPIERLGLELVCVVHEWMDGEIAAFKPYWPGKVYLDKGRQLFSLVGGGALHTGSALPLLNPFSKMWRRIFQARKHVREFNIKGNGWIMGGVLVVKQGGGLTYLHLEKELGLPAPHEQVYEAACDAAGAASAGAILVEEAGEAH